VLWVEYRLAPEQPYPAAIDEALSAYRGLRATGVTPARIAFVGESAGVRLALAALVAARDAGLPQPSAAVVFSPWVGLTLSGPRMEAKDAIDPLWLPQGILPPTGNRIDARCCDVFKLKNGRIQLFDCYPSGAVTVRRKPIPNDQPSRS
jgi:alpha/beta hydrolase fold